MADLINVSAMGLKRMIVEAYKDGYHEAVREMESRQAEIARAFEGSKIPVTAQRKKVSDGGSEA